MLKSIFEGSTCAQAAEHAKIAAYGTCPARTSEGQTGQKHRQKIDA
jgi:hypothetical protein